MVKPFIILGMNAIAAYFLSEFIEIIIDTVIVHTNVFGQSIPLKDYLFTDLFLSWNSPVNASLLWAICYVILLFLLMSVLYGRKIFIKV